MNKIKITNPIETALPCLVCKKPLFYGLLEYSDVPFKLDGYACLSCKSIIISYERK